MTIIYARQTYDLSNWAQERAAAGIAYTVAVNSQEGRLAPTLMMADRPIGYLPEIDGRSAVAKELAAAEKAMWEAISRFDSARLAGKELEKSTRK